MKERLRLLGHVLPIKDDRLAKVVCFFFLPSIRDQKKRKSSQNGVRRGHNGGCLRVSDLGTSWEGVKSFEQTGVEEKYEPLCWVLLAWCCRVLGAGSNSSSGNFRIKLRRKKLGK